MKKLFITLVSCTLVLLTKAQSPNFQWAKKIGGTTSNDHSYVNCVKADASGNVYSAGWIAGTVDVDPGLATQNLTAQGMYDIFISKLDNNGNLLWAKSMGDVSYDEVYSIVLDNTGNIYATGCFKGTVDFDPSGNVYNLTSNGDRNVFILKLDANGNFVWAKTVYATSDMYAYTIALDASNNVYINGTGINTFADFDPGAGVFNLNGTYFILKLDFNGNFVWAKGFSANYCGQWGHIMAVNASGEVYTSGCFNSTTDFDPNVGVFNLAPNGLTDVFVSKLDVSGNFVWAKNYGGAGNHTRMCSISIDGAGNLYSTGDFSGTVDFDPGAGIFNITGTTGHNIFISKLDAAGNFIFAKHFVNVTSGNQVKAQSINGDGLGNSYTLGNFTGTVDFDPGVGTSTLTSNSTNDLYITKLDANGNFVWVKQLGNVGSNITSCSITTDLLGNIYSSGWFSNASVDFDPNAGVFNLTPLASGGYNGFVHKMSQPDVTSIESYNNSTEISIYPNPNNGAFTINVLKPNSSTIVEVYNCLGALVYKSALANQHTPIDLTNHANGLYFVKVLTNNTLLNTQKIIKY